MPMTATMTRLKQRMADLGLSPREVSMRATGTTDTVRNWLRRAEEGASFSMRQDTLEKVSQVLGVTAQWLLTGEDASAPPRPAGLAESSAEYTPAPSEAEAVRSLFAKTSRHPVAFRKVTCDMPRFDLRRGDLLITDLSRDARAGDLVATHVEQDGTVVTQILRLIPPLLLSGDYTQDENPLRIDQPGVTIRYPVIGCVRGAT